MKRDDADFQRDRDARARYELFERRKQEWIEASLRQPSVSPGEYERAVARIARECGV